MTTTKWINRDGHLTCRIETWVFFVTGIVIGAFIMLAVGNMSPAQADTKPLVIKVTSDPCPSDEYVPEYGPCVWDAKHMGNGEGKSFLISKAGAFLRIKHVRAHCMLRPHVAGECRELARTRVWQVEPYGGCDEAWRYPHTPGWRWCKRHGERP